MGGRECAGTQVCIKIARGRRRELTKCWSECNKVQYYIAYLICD